MAENHFEGASPALAQYEVTTLAQAWSRPGLSPRDRSVVTLSALITRNADKLLQTELSRALDNGLKPIEISEIITHLAFYAGWGNAETASMAAREVFAARGIKAEALAPISPELLPLDEKAEAKRAQNVSNNFAHVASGVVQYTGDLLFKDLWLRPGLAPRDRSLATVAALVTSSQVAQIPFHLNRAMDNGLTQEQAGEAFTQLAFYAGWPNVFTALPVAKDVFEKRGR